MASSLAAAVVFGAIVKFFLVDGPYQFIVNYLNALRETDLLRNPTFGDELIMHYSFYSMAISPATFAAAISVLFAAIVLTSKFCLCLIVKLKFLQ